MKNEKSKKTSDAYIKITINVFQIYTNWIAKSRIFIVFNIGMQNAYPRFTKHERECHTDKIVTHRAQNPIDNFNYEQR